MKINRKVYCCFRNIVVETVRLFLLIVFVPIFMMGQRFDIESVKSNIGIVYENKQPIGTGFLCQYPNLIMTCAHIFKNEEIERQFVFRANDGDFVSELVYIDQKMDVAVLKLKYAMEASPLMLVGNFEHKKGETLVMAGYDQYSINLERERILFSEVRILAFKNLDKGDGVIKKLVGFYGSADYGFSGGPLFNLEEKVVGMITNADFDSKNPDNPKESFNVAVILEDLSSILDSLSKNERSK